MIIRSSRHNNIQGNILSILIGKGLIGSAIEKFLSTDMNLLQEFKMDWSDVDGSIKRFKALPISFEKYDKLEIIWSAGKAGFLASEEETAIEKRNFSKWISVLQMLNKQQNIRLWLMSSAGGLHEGQVCVNEQSGLSIKRPYGELKLYQERLIEQSFKNFVICRISSVYTTYNLDGRMGLLPVMIKNCIQNTVMTLYGSESTLRDYVLDEDIASFVSLHIKEGSKLHGIKYLVAGFPLSILTIKSYVEKISLKKLFVQYIFKGANAENISFMRSLKADNFNVSSLETNLKILYNRVLSY